MKGFLALEQKTSIGDIFFQIEKFSTSAADFGQKFGRGKILRFQKSNQTHR